MSESALGVSVAATRQNDGRFAYGLAPPPPRRSTAWRERHRDLTPHVRVAARSLIRLARRSLEDRDAIAANRSEPVFLAYLNRNGTKAEHVAVWMLHDLRELHRRRIERSDVGSLR